MVLALAPERLITGHFDPIVGGDRIAAEVEAMREPDAVGTRPHCRGHERRRRRAHADARGHGARALRRRRGLRQDELERARHLGELQRLVPPPVHHRALRRAGGGGRDRRRGRSRCRARWLPPPVHDSTPERRLPLCTSPTSCSRPSRTILTPSQPPRRPRVPSSRTARTSGSGRGSTGLSTSWRPGDERRHLRLLRCGRPRHGGHQRDRPRHRHGLCRRRVRQSPSPAPGALPATMRPTCACSPTTGSR